MSEKIHMPEALRESFEDYYEGVSDTIDRRSAQWGFECGVLHGESTTRPDYQRVIDTLSKRVLELSSRKFCCDMCGKHNIPKGAGEA